MKIVYDQPIQNKIKAAIDKAAFENINIDFIYLNYDDGLSFTRFLGDTINLYLVPIMEDMRVISYKLGDRIPFSNTCIKYTHEVTYMGVKIRRDFV